MILATRGQSSYATLVPGTMCEQGVLLRRIAVIDEKTMSMLVEKQ